MSNSNIGSIFFDIGDTLATASFPAGGSNLVLTALPGVITVLKKLRDRSIRLGVISNTPDSFTTAMMAQSLKNAGLLEFFLPELLIYSSVIGLKKDSVTIFCFAADRAGFAHDRNKCIFVGENVAERNFAKESGFRVFDAPSSLSTLT